MRISQATIDEIKSRIDIVDVIGDFITLKRSGQNYKAKSPFSDEKTPSFFVFPRNQNFKDFSSGKQGDAITFIMEYDGLNYTEALRYLAKKYGIEIKEEDQSDEEIQAQSERESLMIVLNYANEFFRKNLWETDEGKSIGLGYFRERGFTDETIRKFELGYSLDQWDALEKDAISKGYNPDILEKAGLIIRKEDKTYDRFRGRVIFPVHSHTGKPIAFGARILTSAKNQPKYINSPETVVYRKTDVLYGLFQSSRAIRKEDNCYLVEGYTDVISLHQHGVGNVVSSSGTSLTESQIRLIHRHTGNITVLFDGDAAGIRASLRGIDMILAQGMNVRAVVFPDGEDPDSYSRKLGGLAFQQFLKENARDFIQFKTELLLEGKADDPIKKAETIGQIIASISVIPDQIKRSVYMKETSTQLGIEEDTLYAELNKILIKKRREKQKEQQREEPAELVERFEKEQQKEQTDPITYQEREAIRLLINYGFNEIEEKYKLVEHYLEELDPLEFTHPVYNKIIGIFKEEVGKGNVVEANYFVHHPDEEIRQTVQDILSERYEVSENWERFKIFIPDDRDLLQNSVYTNILRIKFHQVKKLLKIHLRELKEAAGPEEQRELQQMFQELKKAEKTISEPLGIVISG